MKQILISIMMALLIGCATAPTVSEEVFTEPELGFDLLYLNFGVKNLKEVNQIMLANLAFDEGPRISGPIEIYGRGSATVNESTIMFINIAYVMFGYEFDIAIVDTREVWGSIGMGDQFQLLPYYEGVVFNPYNIDRMFKLEPSHIYKFNEVFNIEKFHRLDPASVI